MTDYPTSYKSFRLEPSPLLSGYAFFKLNHKLFYIMKHIYLKFHNFKCLCIQSSLWSSQSLMFAIRYSVLVRRPIHRRPTVGAKLNKEMEMHGILVLYDMHHIRNVVIFLYIYLPNHGRKYLFAISYLMCLVCFVY